EVVLNLDVAPLAGKDWQDIVGVRVRRAIDANGRLIPATHRTDPGPSPQDFADGNVMIMNGRMAMWSSGDVPVARLPQPNPRLVPVTLRTGDGSIRSLRLLEGEVQVEVALTNQHLVTVENLGKAAQTTHEAPNMTRITIADIYPMPRHADQTA